MIPVEFSTFKQIGSHYTLPPWSNQTWMHTVPYLDGTGCDESPGFVQTAGSCAGRVLGPWSWASSLFAWNKAEQPALHEGGELNQN